ncbi:MAG: 3-dehydroquinate synthase [Bacteroidales bacterium]|nr:3-dehydroquinate synthase [Bacteroidales bacterium]
MTTIQNPEYTVYIGNGSLRSLKDILFNDGNDCRIFVLLDENIREHCLQAFLEKTKIPPETLNLIEIKSGEQNKTLDNCKYIWTKLTEGGADRKSILINLGGGVITDMGGFAAASFKRGIKFINIPTSLLAQVDAALGGKTGINLDHLKNQIGLFQNPDSIFIDADFLNSLPKQHLISGFAEVIKYGLIYDKIFWERICKINIEEVSDWYDWIIPSVKIKMNIVDQDPFEKNLRKILNFGHTIAHAFETLSSRRNNRPIYHGEAVAIGLVIESIISTKILGLNEQVSKDIFRLIYPEFNLPQFSNDDIPELINIMMHDKKNINTQINFTLIKEIGDTRRDQFCEREVIEDSLIGYIDKF